MRDRNGNIVWEATEEHARVMTNTELHGALLDIEKTLPAAEAMDLEKGTLNANYYRDEASVYRAEIARRVNADVQRRARTALTSLRAMAAGNWPEGRSIVDSWIKDIERALEVK
jgi:hypothetical protein